MSIPFRPLACALALAAIHSIGSAQPAQEPIAPRTAAPTGREPSDAALGEQMSHCAAVLFEVRRQSAARRLAMNARDATALMRYTMLASAALLGEQKGHAEVKSRQAQLQSKLNLTREENINRVLDAEAATCIEAVEANKEALNKKVVGLPDKP